MPSQLVPLVALQRATAGDWPQIQALLQGYGLPLSGAREHLDDFIVARAGSVVGCIGLERYGAAGLLRSLAVEVKYRGSGLGRALAEACIAHGRAHGVDEIVLLTETAESFFSHLGFTRVDRSAVPDAVRASTEFQGACPSTAVAMIRRVVARAPRMPVEARPATTRDLPVIATIYNEGIRSRGATFETVERTPDEIASWLDDPEYPVIVAERDGTVVGWARASAYRPRAAYAGIREFSVYVADGARGAGIGGALLRALMEACERIGCHKLVSRVFPENEASRALCRANGFREVGTYVRHARLDGEWRDVVIVERLIGPGA